MSFAYFFEHLPWIIIFGLLAQASDVCSEQPSSNAATNKKNAEDNNTYTILPTFAKIGLPTFFVILIFIASLFWKYCGGNNGKNTCVCFQITYVGDGSNKRSAPDVAGFELGQAVIGINSVEE